MKTLTYVLILILAVFSYSYAEIPSDKTSSIEKMFQLMGIEKQMKGGFEAMLPMVDQVASQLQLNAQEKEQLKDIYREWFENDIDRKVIKEKMIKLYAANFTTEEINELNKFYSSPVGQKFLEKSPGLMKLGAQIGMEEAQRKQAKLMERLQPFLDEQ